MWLWSDNRFQLWISRLTRGVIHDGTDLWKVLLAFVALGDICACWPVLKEGWRMAAAEGFSVATKDDAFTNNEVLFFDKEPQKKNEQENDEEVCWSSYYTMNTIFSSIGTLFCGLCIIEAVVRAKQARQHVLEMEALNDFEQKLANLYSSTRWGGNHNNNNNKVEAEEEESARLLRSQQAARMTLRFWTPVISTLAFWFVLLPWKSLISIAWNMRHNSKTFLALGCGNDTALATRWMQLSLQQTTASLAVANAVLVHHLWKVAMPFQFWQTRQFIKRAKLLLRWVRYIRFSGPLGRIAFKLNDQFWVFYNTRNQHTQVQTEKEKRIRRRSMLFEDLQRVESLVKLQTRLAKVPSQMFNMAQNQAAHIQDVLQQQKQHGLEIKAQLQQLKSQIRSHSQVFPSSDLYDKIVTLSQDISSTFQMNSRRIWNAHLISPHTRFSVVWRLIVTFALLSELSRICTSYQLYGRVNVSFTDMMKAVLGCQSSVNTNLLTAYGRWTRKVFRKVLRVKVSPTMNECTALTSHNIANILLKLCGAFEVSVDIVCFLDIFVWFLTGELDGATGIVIPKPFFYRCILPGTLVQVLDHPTLPHVLPNVISWSVAAANAVGYSRMVRWILAIVPALDLIPLQRFLFQPMGEEEWLRYTESLAFLPAISGADIRYAVSHTNLMGGGSGGGGGGSPPLKRAEASLHLFPSSTSFASQQAKPSTTNLANLRQVNSKVSLLKQQQQHLQGIGMDLSEDNYTADNSIFDTNNEGLKRNSSRWTLHPLDESYSFSYGNLNY